MRWALGLKKQFSSKHMKPYVSLSGGRPAESLSSGALEMKPSRRKFLRQSGCSLTAAALIAGMERFTLIDALAQADDYKALVCIFLFGGNDSNNMIIPYDDYGAYAAVRSSGA